MFVADVLFHVIFRYAFGLNEGQRRIGRRRQQRVHTRIFGESHVTGGARRMLTCYSIRQVLGNCSLRLLPRTRSTFGVSMPNCNCYIPENVSGHVTMMTRFGVISREFGVTIMARHGSVVGQLLVVAECTHWNVTR